MSAHEAAEWALAECVSSPDGCLLWPGGVDSKGYGQIGIGSSITLTHRLIYRELIAPIPEGACVLHLCDVPRCCRPEHLRLGTQAENILDMERKGRARHLHGEQHGRAKLTADCVREIRAKAGSASVAAMAAEFGVVETTIVKIVKRELWKSVV